MQSLDERAFQLAPECSTMAELKQRLTSEGFNGLENHLGGPGTKRQLKARFNQGQGAKPTGPRPRPKERGDLPDWEAETIMQLTSADNAIR